MDKDEKQSFLPIPSLPRKKRRLFHRKKHVPPQRKRLVEKSGYINLRIESERRFYHFVRDAYTTLLGMKWRYVVSLYFSTLSTSWIMFAFAYQLQSWYNEDFEVHDGPHTPCIYNTETFTDMLIYSFATQSTVGYGHRHMSNKCIGVVFSSMMQLMLGTLLHGLMTAFIINKMARPMKRTATLMFSKNAVVAMRDGKLCLMVRIGDMRKTCLAEAHVRMQRDQSLQAINQTCTMIQKTMTYEGDMLPYHQFEMDVGFKEGLDRVMVMWPITIVHEINEESPLYTISQESLNDPMTRFEIILILEGVVESSGSTAQARTSYTPSEVLWGRRFDRLATYHRRDGTYQVDMAKFHSTVEASNTPPFSAKQLEFMRKKGQFVEADTTFDEDSLMNQTTIHEIKDHSRPGILTDPTKTDSVSIQIESDNELDEDIPEDDANLAGPHRKHTAVFRRECDLF
ncbi:hypothetical protein L596_027895 [Steinernema carpocapsae]|uniref:Uncharacterized protein n=1 Tax=Steinernema carpocapsae TaxID=34508 RepID=A0A4U5LWV1_STECR|nr:hypothetical protein L596_027895 [Steinernema carpocapsae]